MHLDLEVATEPASFIKIEEFDVDYSGREYFLETLDLKITLDKYQFENLRNKMNELHEDLS